MTRGGVLFSARKWGGLCVYTVTGNRGQEVCTLWLKLSGVSGCLSLPVMSVCVQIAALSLAPAGALWRSGAVGPPGRGWSVGRALLSWMGPLFPRVAVSSLWRSLGWQPGSRLGCCPGSGRWGRHQGHWHTARLMLVAAIDAARRVRPEATGPAAWFGPWVVPLWCGLARPARLWPPLPSPPTARPPSSPFATTTLVSFHPNPTQYTDTHTTDQHHHSTLFPLFYTPSPSFTPPPSSPLSTSLRRLRTPPSFGRHTRSICLHTSPARTHTHTNTDLTKLKFAQPPANQQ